MESVGMSVDLSTGRSQSWSVVGVRGVSGLPK